MFDAYPPSGSSDYGYGGSSYSNIPLDFGAQESRKGDHTKGSYDVLLPDGQRQTVTYYVDGKSGYVADVKYTQEVNPEPYNPPKQGSYAMPGSNYASGPYVEPSMMTAYSDTPYTSNPYTTAYSSNPYTTAYNSKAYSTYSSAPYTASYGHNPYMME